MLRALMNAAARLAFVLVATFVLGVSTFVAVSAFQGSAVAGMAGLLLVVCQTAMLYYTYVRFAGLQSGKIGADESRRLLRHALLWGAAAAVSLGLLAVVWTLTENGQ
jgi:hypothetical protein